MMDLVRLWFVGAYLLGFIFFLALIFRFRSRRPTVQQKDGPLPRPMIAFGVTKQSRAEEEMLRAKFGSDYDAYAGEKGRLVPLFSPRYWGF